MLEEKNMKKLSAILLSVSLVMSVAVLFSSAAPEKAPLTATAYATEEDNDYIYVVFSKKVAAPGDDVHVILASTDENGIIVSRFNTSDELIVVSECCWKFSQEAWKNDWAVGTNLYNPINGYYPNYPVANCGLYIEGTISTADGEEKLAMPENNKALRLDFIHTDKKSAIPQDGSDALSAAAYVATDDDDWVYVKFNRPVVTPGNDVRIALGGDASDGVNIYTSVYDPISSVVEVISPTLWRFSASETWRRDWQVAVNAWNPVDGYYPGFPISNCRLCLYGTVTDTNGVTLPVNSSAMRLYTNLGKAEFVASYTLSYNRIESVDSIPGVITAKAYAPADDNDYIYVEFSKPMKAPGNDVRITLAGKGTPDGGANYYMYSFNLSDEVIAVSDRVWKFSEKAWKPDWEVGRSVYNPVDGYYPGQQVAQCGIYILGGISAEDGETFIIPHESAQYEFGRLHRDWSGSNFICGLRLDFEKVDSVNNIPSLKKIHSPSTSDSGIITCSAAAAAITAAGLIYCRKRRKAV